MSITIRERVESRETTAGDSPSQTRLYVVTGTNSEFDAIAALNAGTPFALDIILIRREVSVEPVGDPLLSLTWSGTVTYGSSASGSNKPAEEGALYVSFDTGSASVHITQSIETSQQVAIYPAEVTNRHRAINSSKEGTEGIDIIAPELRFSITKYFAYDYVDQSYLRTLTDLAGTTNAARFQNFAVGEVLFLNASGNRRGTDEETDGWEITFNFAVQRNIPEGYSPAPGLLFPEAISGWDYMWVSYESVKDDDSKIRTSKPKEAYVEKVYNSGNFSRLGI